MVLAAAPVYNRLSLSCPARGNKEDGQRIGYLGSPGSGALGYPCGHRQVLAIATTVAAHEGDDDVGESDIEDGGEEERYEEALARRQHTSAGVTIAATGYSRRNVALVRCDKTCCSCQGTHLDQVREAGGHDVVVERLRLLTAVGTVWYMGGRSGCRL